MSLPGPETRFFTGRDPEEEARRQWSLMQDMALGVPERYREGQVRQEDAARQSDLLEQQQDFDLRAQAQAEARQNVQTLQQALASMRPEDEFFQEGMQALRYYQSIAGAETGADAARMLGASTAIEETPTGPTWFDPTRATALALTGATAGAERATREAEEREQARTFARMQFDFDLDTLSLEQQNTFATRLAVLNADLTRGLTKGEYELRMKEILADHGFRAEQGDIERAWNAQQNDLNRDLQLELQRMQLSAAARDSLLDLISRFNPANPMEREQLEAIRSDPNYAELTPTDRLNVDLAIRAQYTEDAAMGWAERKAELDDLRANTALARGQTRYYMTIADHQEHETRRAAVVDGQADQETLLTWLSNEATRGVPGLTFLNRLAGAYERMMDGNPTPGDEMYRNYFDIMGASQDALDLIGSYIQEAQANADDDALQRQLREQEGMLALNAGDDARMIQTAAYYSPSEIAEIANMEDDDPRLQVIGPDGKINPLASQYQFMRERLQDPIQAFYINRESALAEQVRNEPEIARLRGEIETLINTYPEVQGTQTAANTLRGLLSELARYGALGDGTGWDPVEGPSAVTSGVIESLVSGALRTWGDSREAFNNEQAQVVSDTVLNYSQAAYYDALARQALDSLGDGPGGLTTDQAMTILENRQSLIDSERQVVLGLMQASGCSPDILAFPDPVTVEAQCQAYRVDLDILAERLQALDEDWVRIQDDDNLRRIHHQIIDEVMAEMPEASPEVQGQEVQDRFDRATGVLRPVPTPEAGVTLREVPRDPAVPENDEGAFSPEGLTRPPAPPPVTTEEEADRLDQELIANLEPEVRGLVDEFLSGERDMPRPGNADLNRWVDLAIEYGWPGTEDIDRMRQLTPAQRRAAQEFQRHVTGAVNILRQGE